MRNFCGPALAALVAGCCLSANVGPPFLTDDPAPVDLHHAEINWAYQRTRTDAGSSGAIAADVNWGCAHETQCHFAVPLAFSHPVDAGARSGLGDLELGLKYRFLNLPDSGFMTAVYPTAFLPTGSASRGLGNGQLQVLLPVWLQKSWGPWTLDAGAAYTVNRAAGARSSWFTGLVLQRPISDRLRIGAELFHRTATAVDVPQTTGFDIGTIVEAVGQQQLADVFRKGTARHQFKSRGLVLRLSGRPLVRHCNAGETRTCCTCAPVVSRGASAGQENSAWPPSRWKGTIRDRQPASPKSWRLIVCHGTRSSPDA